MEVVTLFVVGVGLWVLVPLVERRGGDTATTALLAGGALMFGTASWYGLTAGGMTARGMGLTALGVLGWGTWQYLSFRQSQSGRIWDSESFPSFERRCVSALRYGEPASDEASRDTWRTYLDVWYRSHPTDCDLHLRARVRGAAFYGFFVRKADEVLELTVRVKCFKHDDRCLPSAIVTSPTGTYGARDQVSKPPVSARIVTTISESTEQVRVSVRMIGQLGAPGLMSGSLSVGVVQGGLAQPDASECIGSDMGTFIWNCRATGECA